MRVGKEWAGGGRELEFGRIVSAGGAKVDTHVTRMYVCSTVDRLLRTRAYVLMGMHRVRVICVSVHPSGIWECISIFI